MPESLRRLRIVQVITPHRFAGAERACAHLSAALRDRGHDVLVVMPARVPQFRQYIASLAVPVETIPIAGKLNPRGTAALASVLRDFSADVVHSHLSTASVRSVRAARRVGIPAVAHVHAMNSARWYGGADLVLACTHGVAEHLRRQGLGTPIEVVYNGLRMAEFDNLRPSELVRGELGLSADQPVVGAVASLTKRKGHEYLLRALPPLLHRWPSLKCLVVGSGPLDERLRRLARTLGIAEAVDFLGFRSDRLDIMQVMDVLVLPSVAIEGFGLVVIEAAALAVPAVASDLPGIDEAVVDGETGLLVPPADPQALAAGIARLLADENLRRRLGEAARQRALRQFTVERMAGEVEACYRRVLGVE